MERVIRVYGIDCPELPSRAGYEAKAIADSLAPVGSTIVCTTAKKRECDSFGRWLARITLLDGRDFAAEMIQRQGARAYLPLEVEDHV